MSKNIYAGKTQKEIWDDMSINQRLHFIIDHTGKQHTPVTQNTLSRKAYNFLPEDVKQELKGHTMMGSYGGGGKAGKGKPARGKKKTKTITVFSFDELSSSAKDKALDGFRYAQTEDQWWDYMYEDAENIGLKLTGFDLDRNKHATGKFMASAEETAHKIEKEHGESTATYKTAKEYLKDRDVVIDTAPKDVNGDFEDEGALDEKLDELDEEFLKSLLEDYAQMLRNEYEHLQSDESVKEFIEANDYEFMEDGSQAQFEKGGEAGSGKTSGINWIITGTHI